MSRGCLLFAALVLLLPVAAADYQPMPRCTQFACASFYDADGDGIPEGVRGGTATFVHEAPTVSFGSDAYGFYVMTEALVGEEYEPDGVFANVILAGERDGARVYRIDAYVGVLDHNGETGEMTPYAEPWVVLYDSNGDGVVDSWRVYGVA